MAKNKTVYFCTACGNETPKWQGKCPACGAWNTLEEHIERQSIPGKVLPKNGSISRNPVRLHEISGDNETRFLQGV